MLRSIAELVAYGALAVLLMLASADPAPGNAASSATTSDTDPLPNAVRSESGALLFATKGCVGCHMHAAFPGARMQVGPNLTDLAQRAATRVAGLDARSYVRQSIREPGMYRAPGNSTAVMPNLRLSDDQIESLTTFLLSFKR